MVNPLSKLFVGGSAYYSENTKTFTLRRKFAAEIRYELPVGFLQTEYLAATEQTTDKNGWYVYAFLTPLKSLQTGLRYEVYDPSNSVSNDESDGGTFGVNYFFNPLTKLTLNLSTANTKEKPVYNYAVLRVQFTF